MCVRPDSVLHPRAGRDSHHCTSPVQKVKQIESRFLATAARQRRAFPQNGRPTRPRHTVTRTRIAILAGALFLLAGGAAVNEVLWRIHHGVVLTRAPSPDEARIAEVRLMPEQSAVPYGQGVFIRSRWAVLLGLQSELAFAGYCNHLALRWTGEQQLQVHCEGLTGTPVVPGPVVRGVKVDIVLQPAPSKATAPAR